MCCQKKAANGQKKDATLPPTVKIKIHRSTQPHQRMSRSKKRSMVRKKLSTVKKKKVPIKSIHAPMRTNEDPYLSLSETCSTLAALKNRFPDGPMHLRIRWKWFPAAAPCAIATRISTSCKCTSKGATFETPYLANWHGLGVTYNILLPCLLLFRLVASAKKSLRSVLKLARVRLSFEIVSRFTVPGLPTSTA